MPGAVGRIVGVSRGGEAAKEALEVGVRAREIKDLDARRGE